MNPDFRCHFGAPLWDTPAYQARQKAARGLRRFKAGYDRTSRDRRNKQTKQARRRNRR